MYIIIIMVWYIPGILYIPDILVLYYIYIPVLNLVLNIKF